MILPSWLKDLVGFLIRTSVSNWFRVFIANKNPNVLIKPTLNAVWERIVTIPESADLGTNLWGRHPIFSTIPFDKNHQHENLIVEKT